MHRKSLLVLLIILAALVSTLTLFDISFPNGTADAASEITTGTLSHAAKNASANAEEILVSLAAEFEHQNYRTILSSVASGLGVR